jgi:hypothetical protein
MQTRLFAVTALIAGLAGTTLLAAAATTGPSVQALLGAVRYDNLTIQNANGTSSQTSDSSTMPQFGGVWSTAPKGEKLQIGLECSFLMGFNYGSVSYSPTPASRVYTDYSLWMVDLAGGLYANLFLGKAEKIRIYAAGGPLLSSAFSYSESYQDNAIGADYFYRNNENAFGYGLYARTGFEFRVQEYGLLGLGVRGTWVDTDLSSIGDLTGIGAFVTYTAGL